MTEMNDFIDAIENNSSDEEKEVEASSERYNRLKKEQADVEQGTPAQKRYQELKEKAKQDMIEEERKKAQEQDSENEEDTGEEEFITH